MQAENDTIRTFNRFELKYLLPIADADVFKKAIKAFLHVDSHCEKGEYALTSLYYDTPDRKFYWEKIDGIKVRRKLRIRHYEMRDYLTPDTPVYVEIKKRVDRIILKSRARLPYKDALNLCNKAIIPEKFDINDRKTLEEIQSMVLLYQLRPTLITSYFRHALIGTEYNLGLRVTFDTNIRYRDRDLDLSSKNRGKFMIPPAMAIMEIKANGSIPYWLTEMIGAHNIRLIRVSKYCSGLETAQKKSTLQYIF